MSNRNETMTQDFAVGTHEIPMSSLTKAEKIVDLRAKIEGGHKVVNHLLEGARKAIAQGNKNEALLCNGEANSVLDTVKALTSAMKALEAEIAVSHVMKKFPNFFERREIHATALALGKSEETVLADKANLATANRRAWKGQKVNRNIAPAKKDVADLMGAKDTRDPINEKSMCARHCQKDGKDVQGRSNCNYCHGVGFNAMSKLKESKCAQ